MSVINEKNMNTYESKHSPRNTPKSTPAQLATAKNSGASLKDNRPEPVTQLASKVTNQAQAYNYGSGKVNVGKSMIAHLDPNHMPHGQSANINKSQDDMMAAIRKGWKIVGGGVVKGHLLNDNLGGTALNNNLYPITRAANKDHLMYVENVVKDMVWNDHTGVYYEVKVEGNPTIKDPTATFHTRIAEWNPKTDKYGKVVKTISVPSDFKSVSKYHQVFDTDDPNADLETTTNPHKPKWALHPKTKVSELTKQEAYDRDNQA